MSRQLKAAQLGLRWSAFVWMAYLASTLFAHPLLEWLTGRSSHALTPYSRALYLCLLLVGFIFVFVPNLQLIRPRLSRPETAFIACVLSVSVISGARGIYNENPTVYLFADLSYVLIATVLYLSTRWTGVQFQLSGKALWLAIVVCGIVLPTIRMSIGSGSLGPSVIAVAAAVLALAVARNNIRLTLGSLAAVAMLGPSLNRGALIALMWMMLVSAVAFMRPTFRRSTMPIAPALLVLAAASLFLVLDRSQALTDSPIQDRYNRTREAIVERSASADVSIAQRKAEAGLVMNSFEGKWWSYLVGQGAGATFDQSTGIDSTVANSALLGSADVHNIHLLHYAVLYRFGLLGLVLMTLIVGKVIMLALTPRDSIDFLLAAVASAIIVMSSVASSYFFVEPVLWLSLGLLASRRHGPASLDRPREAIRTAVPVGAANG